MTADATTLHNCILQENETQIRITNTLSNATKQTFITFIQTVEANKRNKTKNYLAKTIQLVRYIIKLQR